MTSSYQPHADRRATRFRLAEATPAVLQFPNTGARCELEIISRTGGLLSVAKAVDQGSVATLMFRTHKGLVFATAEMLRALSSSHQPFRFIELEDDDKRKLQAAFQSGLYRNIQEEELIEEFRVAAAHWNPPRRKRSFSPTLAAAALAGFAALGSGVIYILGVHLR